MDARYRVILCEDEAVVANMIASYCEELGYDVVKVLYGDEEVDEIIKNELPDILLMDINLGEKNGLAIYNNVQQLQIPVIFITAYSDQENIKRALGFDPAGYIVKPFTKAQLMVQLNLAEQKIGTRTFLDVDTAEGHTRLAHSEILYLEAQRNYTRFVLLDGKEVKLRGALKTFQEILPANWFMYIHRSYLINRLHLIQFNSDFCLLKSNVKLPVGRSYRPVLRG
ncbi:MAG: response regulator transcription factor [Cyclobacteriaceae bacterium]|nr:response regulator transcription factor [Cyclobacteriaceae bacterium]